ncbi:prepilin-type N-terminal cleavage/methylation domain-containing protein [Candidatus Microgenomates bacterium]|nr:prepilin-type N-terminal cleavage/methylation domain-containing protein [Candidatus Microgenomates bacterium]
MPKLVQNTSNYQLLTNNSRGYTIIELLVVITIIAILSAIVFINSRTLAQDQILNKAVGQIQSALRLAQSNATAGLKCGSPLQGGASWSAQFGSDKTKVEIYCDKTATVQQTFSLENVQVSEIQGSSCPSSSPPPVSIKYSPLYGLLTFEASDSCIGLSNTLTITVSNLTGGNSKSFTLSKGGAIDVE